MTLDQIEELRRGEKPSLSLRQAAMNVGLPFVGCSNCKGAGYTSAILLVSGSRPEGRPRSSAVNAMIWKGQLVSLYTRGNERVNC